MESFDTDILVIGAGAAGCSVALHAAPRRVLLLAPEGPEGTATACAKGGIAAPLAGNDSVAMHAADTIAAADHSGCPATTTAIVSAAGEAIEFLSRSGVRFDVDDGAPHLHLEAGHSVPRILHADGDRTGAAIQATLWGAARAAAHITLRRDLTAVALLGDGGAIGGVRALDAGGAPAIIRASHTVLATGGLGQLFAATTNPRHAAGDGLAMALASGADVAGLEFVQFHPTALRCKGDPLPLLTEALRGAGARLLADGAGFMDGIDVRGDLAPRDVVARAVWERQKRGQNVAMDARRVFGSPRANDFPSALETCRAHRIDPAYTPIPITCAAHFHMGGVVIDSAGRTSLPGLWAAGEVAYTGLHGANRLASNSLLEAVVIGSAAGRALRCAPLGRRRPWAAQAECVAPFDAALAPWRELREVLWRAMGPVRDGASLALAHRQVAALRRRVDPAQRQLLQRLALAEAMIDAARRRCESRGAHWRRDFPRRDLRRDGGRALHAAGLGG